MRRVLVHLDLDIVRHSPDFAFDDAALEKLVGANVGQTIHRRMGAGASGLKIPDGQGGFVDKPAVLIVVKSIAIEALPDESPPVANGHGEAPTPPAMRIVAP